MFEWVAGGSDDQSFWVICCREVGKMQKRNLSQICLSDMLNHEDRPYRGKKRPGFFSSQVFSFFSHRKKLTQGTILRE